MDVLKAIESRREITQYKTDPVPEELLGALVKSAYLSPKGNNLPSVECIVITNRDTIQSLQNTTPYMKWLQTAPAAIVITGNPQLSKYWLQDASIAGGYIWLTATSIGLGAAWGAVYHAEDAMESERRESYVRSQLFIPESLRVIAILGLGFPDMQPKKKEMYPLKRILHKETYQQPNHAE